MNRKSMTYFSIIYLVLLIDEKTVKSPVFDFVKKRLPYNFLECLQHQQNDQNGSHN